MATKFKSALRAGSASAAVAFRKLRPTWLQVAFAAAEPAVNPQFLKTIVQSTVFLWQDVSTRDAPARHLMNSILPRKNRREQRPGEVPACRAFTYSGSFTGSEDVRVGARSALAARKHCRTAEVKRAAISILDQVDLPTYDHIVDLCYLKSKCVSCACKARSYKRAHSCAYASFGRSQQLHFARSLLARGRLKPNAKGDKLAVHTRDQKRLLRNLVEFLLREQHGSWITSQMGEQSILEHLLRADLVKESAQFVKFRGQSALNSYARIRIAVLQQAPGKVFRDVRHLVAAQRQLLLASPAHDESKPAVTKIVALGTGSNASQKETVRAWMYDGDHYFSPISGMMNQAEPLQCPYWLRAQAAAAPMRYASRLDCPDLLMTNCLHMAETMGGSGLVQQSPSEHLLGPSDSAHSRLLLAFLSSPSLCTCQLQSTHGAGARPPVDDSEHIEECAGTCLGVGVGLVQHGSSAPASPGGDPPHATVGSSDELLPAGDDWLLPAFARKRYMEAGLHPLPIECGLRVAVRHALGMLVRALDGSQPEGDFWERWSGVVASVSLSASAGVTSEVGASSGCGITMAWMASGAIRAKLRFVVESGYTIAGADGADGAARCGDGDSMEEVLTAILRAYLPATHHAARSDSSASSLDVLERDALAWELMQLDREYSEEYCREHTSELNHQDVPRAAQLAHLKRGADHLKGGADQPGRCELPAVEWVSGPGPVSRLAAWLGSDRVRHLPIGFDGEWAPRGVFLRHEWSHEAGPTALSVLSLAVGRRVFLVDVDSVGRRLGACASGSSGEQGSSEHPVATDLLLSVFHPGRLCCVAFSAGGDLSALRKAVPKAIRAVEIGEGEDKQRHRGDLDDDPKLADGDTQHTDTPVLAGSRGLQDSTTRKYPAASKESMVGHGLDDECVYAAGRLLGPQGRRWRLVDLAPRSSFAEPARSRWAEAEGLTEPSGVSQARGAQSLRAVVHRVLGRALDKHWTSSDWARRPLLREQAEYAAMDSWVLLQLVERAFGAKHTPSE